MSISFFHPQENNLHNIIDKYTKTSLPEFQVYLESDLLVICLLAGSRSKEKLKVFILPTSPPPSLLTLLIGP